VSESDSVTGEGNPLDRPLAPRRRFGLALGALLAGVLLAFLLPAPWVFVEDSGHKDMPMDGGRAQYACPMFCTIMDHMPEDGRCPVCGMEMTVITGESTLGAAEQAMVGLEVETVRRLPLVRAFRVVGEVDYDETRLKRITTRMQGWLEGVSVDATWIPVEKGQPLAAIYSPELYAAEKEYLVEWNAGAEAPGSLLAEARRRLELFGVDDREISELEKSGEPRRAVILRSPLDGVVVERLAVEGASVQKGARLYTVADLSRVWVQASVFESDLSWIRIGQSVRLGTEGSAHHMEGRVAFVDPVLDRSTRTARVRIEVDNPAGPDGRRSLRVGQRVDAWIEAAVDAGGELATPGEAHGPYPLAVPRTAVLRTGERNLIYALFEEKVGPEGRTRDYALDPRRIPAKVWYEPVEVRLGPLARVGDGSAGEQFYPVLGVIPPRPRKDSETGKEVEVLSLPRLSEGVAIVTRGNLLLDSQAQLAGRPSLLFPEGNRGGSSDPHAGH